jgi:hypothetical protein
MSEFKLPNFGYASASPLQKAVRKLSRNEIGNITVSRIAKVMSVDKTNETCDIVIQLGGKETLIRNREYIGEVSPGVKYLLITENGDLNESIVQGIIDKENLIKEIVKQVKKEMSDNND